MSILSHSVRCGRCGSKRIRRAHTPEGWGYLLRKWTSLRRYACGTCGYRGWTFAQLSPSPPVVSTPLSARPLEARDLRHRYERRRMIVRGVLVAATLGAAVGFWLFG